MKHRTLLFLAACTCCFVHNALRAAPRTEAEARAIAARFLASKAQPKLRTNQGIKLVATSETIAPAKRTAGEAGAAWYVYNQGQDAFVIVAGDDSMKDVLAYSTDNAFVAEDLPNNLKAWLQAYTALAETASKGTPADETTFRRTTGCPESVSPLLNGIRYDQGAPYNQLCPSVNDEQCVTGCGATALATLLSYYQAPERGTGNKSYTTPSYGLACSFDFSATAFDWANILPTYDGVEYNETQANAVATLMYACGVAAEMNYGLGGSGASSTNILAGTIDHFGFNPYARLMKRSHFDSQTWMDHVCGELAAARPIFYGGSSSTLGGHFFVLDGYDAQGMVHVDWGWSGYNNGYFDLLSLDTYSNATGFAFEQEMLADFAPANLLSTPRSAFYLSDFTCDSQSAHVGSIYNCGHNSTGELAVVAEKEGVQTVVSRRVPFTDLPVYSGYVHMEFPLDTEGVEAGTYTIYMASKLEEESTWSAACGTEFNNPRHTMTIHSDGSRTVQAATDHQNLPTMEVSADGPFFSNMPTTLRVHVVNTRTDSELYGMVRLTLSANGGETVAVADVPVLLAAQQDTTLNVALTLPDGSGQCSVTPIWALDYVVWNTGEPFTLDYAPAITTDEVHLSGFQTDRHTYAPSDVLTCTGKLDIEDTGADAYTGTLYAGLFRITETSWYSVMLEPTTWTVFRGAPVEYEKQLTFSNLEPGTYEFQIGTISEDDGNWNSLWTCPVTIASGTSVDAAGTAGLEAPTYCPRPGETDIRFSYGKEVGSVAVYTMAGHRVADARPQQAADATYVVSANGLGKGTYILRIQAADGTVATLKFIR